MGFELKAHGADAGVFGRVARERLKRLPSSVHWTAPRRKSWAPGRRGRARCLRLRTTAIPTNDEEPPSKTERIGGVGEKRHSALFRRSRSTQPPLRRPFARKSEFLDCREGRLATSNVFGF